MTQDQNTKRRSFPDRLPRMIRGRPRGARQPRRVLTTLVLALFVAGCAAVAYALNVHPQRGVAQGHARVIDGDSLMVGQTEVRIFGIDAPELSQRCQRDGREVACGKEAARQLTTLIAGQLVSCERRDIDRFGRVVALCRVEGVDLGQAMVVNGHAVAFGSAYAAEERSARSERRGLWSGEFMRPREWRDRERARQSPGI